MEILRQEGQSAGLPVIAPSQKQRIAQRINLVRALPHPAGRGGAILAPRAAVVFPVEGVGVGINEDAGGLPGKQPLHQRGHGGLVAKADVVEHLHGRIPQPHGLDVPGDHKGIPGAQGLNGGFKGVHEAALEHIGQAGNGGQRLLYRSQARADGV